MSRERILGLLSITGGLLGLALVIVFSTTDFDYPGTAAYATYETLNRLIALPLLLMVCGWMGLALKRQSGAGRNVAWAAFAASLIMAAGTAAEFWFFSDQPYGVWTNGRMASFMAFFIASLVLYVSATLVGVVMWRDGADPRAGAVVLMASIPLYALVIFTVNSNFLVPAFLALTTGRILLLADRDRDVAIDPVSS